MWQLCIVRDFLSFIQSNWPQKTPRILLRRVHVKFSECLGLNWQRHSNWTDVSQSVVKQFYWLTCSPYRKSINGTHGYIVFRTFRRAPDFVFPSRSKGALRHLLDIGRLTERSKNIQMLHSREYNERWGWSTGNDQPCQKVPTISRKNNAFVERFLWSDVGSVFEFPKIAHLLVFKFCLWDITVSHKTTNCSIPIVKLLSVYGRYIFLIWEKKWEGSVHSSYLNVKNMWITFHIVVHTDLNLSQKSGKN